MKSQIAVPQNKKSYLKNSSLIILAFASVFFPRIIETAGAPSLINFVHFPLVILTTIIVLTTSQTKNRKQIAVAKTLISGLFVLLGVMIASAMLNQAGIVNLLLDFLMLGEPFLLLLTIVYIPMSPTIIKRLKTWLIVFSLINLFSAFVQRFLLLTGAMQPPGNMTLEDAVQGVFFYSGAGNYVSATISVIVALYCFISFKTAPLLLRCAGLLLAFIQLIISDSKQVLIALIVALIILAAIKSTELTKLLTYLLGTLIVLAILFWCVQNLDSFSAFKNWTGRLELYGPNGEGTKIKLSALGIIASHYESLLNLFFGLGPGHTVSRLGGWIIPEKWDLLSPLGATIHPASKEVWRTMYASWVARESTMFSPLFGWAGIWGDLGLFGLGAYSYLGYVVWRYLCLDDVYKFLLLNVAVFGLIFSQMEEPGYMLSVAFIIGLGYQERLIHQAAKVKYLRSILKIQEDSKI